VFRKTGAIRGIADLILFRSSLVRDSACWVVARSAGAGGSIQASLSGHTREITVITLYEQHDSGNCYKVRLVLAHRNQPFQTVAMSSMDGSTRRADFLAKNPIGRVPTVQLDDGRFLAESNAILLFFGEGTDLIPADAYDRAKVYEWLFFEQYNHEPAIAVRRALSVYPERRADATPERMAQLLENGNRALGVMEKRLKDADWLAADAFSVADISLYAYTHMAAAGGYDLAQFPGIQRWLDRVAALPRHVSIES
jgi:glutathione S-transferase